MSIKFGASIAYRHLLTRRSEYHIAIDVMRNLTREYDYNCSRRLYVKSDYFCTRSYEWPEYKIAVGDLANSYSRWKEGSSQNNRENADKLFRLALSCSYLGEDCFLKRGSWSAEKLNELLSPIPLFIPITEINTSYIVNNYQHGLGGLSFLCFRIGSKEEIIESTAILCSIMSKIGDENSKPPQDEMEEPCVGILGNEDEFFEEEEEE